MRTIWIVMVLLLGNLRGQVTVSTLAGNDWYFANGPGEEATFYQPTGIAMDANGNIYVADMANHLIRKITPSGEVSTFAGSVSGFADGISTDARFTLPSGVAVDNVGNVYVADYGNHSIRKITPAGDVLTLAGNGVEGYADGNGSSAQFFFPFGLTVDDDGNVYVADQYNNRIRKVTPAGLVTTLAGNGNAGYADGMGVNAQFSMLTGVAIDANGNLFVSDSWNNCIRKISPAGEVSTFAGSIIGGYEDGAGSAARFSYPTAITVDENDNIYVAQRGNERIRKVTPSGIVTTVAGSKNGYLDTLAASAKFYGLAGVAVDGNGDIYVSEDGNHLIRKITNNGIVTTLAGKPQRYADGQGTSARLCRPSGVAFDHLGNLYIADNGNHRIRKISPQGLVSTVAGNGTYGFQDGTGHAAEFNRPTDLVLDGSGNIYVADAFNFRIRKITTGGVVSTFAGSDAPGYVDGVGSQASFYHLGELDIDGYGNLYVADMENHCIRKISPTGVVSTLTGNDNPGYTDGDIAVAQFRSPFGLAIDGNGNVYVTDIGNYCIRKISPTGIVSTLAGSGIEGYADGTGVNAQFSGLSGLTLDALGNLYVSDRNRIRKVTPTGVVTTLAGSSFANYADGLGTSAMFAYPAGMAINCDGLLYIADEGNNRIRKIVLDEDVCRSQEDARLQLYPNPTSADLTVVAPQPGTYLLQNLLGQPVLQGTLPLGRTTLQLEALSADTYLLRATIGTATELHKVVKR